MGMPLSIVMHLVVTSITQTRNQSVMLDWKLI